MQKRIDLIFCLIVLPAMIAIFPVERWVQNFPIYTIGVFLWLYLLYFINRRQVVPRIIQTDGTEFPDFSIEGPQRAGADILLHNVLPDYPNTSRPVDFLIRDKRGNIKAVGLAHYDSDRGGSQEDDRTGGYMNFTKEFLEYAKSNNSSIKIIFINDGPGLLLGSMWEDYSKLESVSHENIRVVTLRMINERITKKWLKNR